MSNEQEKGQVWNQFMNKIKIWKKKNSSEHEPITDDDPEDIEEIKKHGGTIVKVDQDKLSKSENSVAGRFRSKFKNKKKKAPQPPKLEAQTNGSTLNQEKKNSDTKIQESGASDLSSSESSPASVSPLPVTTSPEVPTVTNSTDDTAVTNLTDPSKSSDLLDASSSEEDDRIAQIDLLIQKTQALKAEIDEYSLTGSENDYLRIDSELTDIMIRLDSIGAETSDIKKKRKEGIKLIQEVLLRLDRFATSNEIEYKL